MAEHPTWPAATTSPAPSPAAGGATAHPSPSPEPGTAPSRAPCAERPPVPEPYYQDPWVTLYHGDALDLMPALARESFAHVVTDPPYILHAGSSSTKGSKTGGWADMMNAAYWYSHWYKIAAGLIPHTGSIWTFGNWRSLPAMQRAAIDAGISAASCVVWDKEWIGPAGPQQLRSQHELCLVLAREGFAQRDRSQGDVLRIKAGSHKPSGHPAEKPVRLLRRILELTGARPGEVILDPFTGSGTVGVAAKSLGLRSVLIEAERRWCEVAANRLAQDALDLTGEAP